MKILKILFLFIGSILLLCTVIIITIRTPWAQNKIVSYAVNYAANKTNTDIQIKRLYVTFSGNVELDGLLIKDQEDRVLFSSEELEIGLSFRSLFKQEYILSPVRWKGVKATIIHTSDSEYNFDFLINAFSDNDTTTVEVEAHQQSTFELDVHSIDLQDFDLHYRDELAGMDAKLVFGNLHLGAIHINLSTPSYSFEDVVFQNSTILIDQFAEAVEKTTTNDTTSTLPAINVDEFVFKNNTFRYTNKKDSIDIKGFVDEYHLKGVNVQDRAIAVLSTALSNSSFSIQLPFTSEIDSIYTKEPTSFIWPDWIVDVGNFEIVNTAFDYNKGNAPNTISEFDPNHIGLNNLNLHLSDIRLADQELQSKLNAFSFQEQSGFDLKQLRFHLLVSDQQLTVDSLRITTKHSDLLASFELAFSSVTQLIHDATSVNLKASVFQSRLSLYDAFYFDQSLNEDTLIQKIKPYPFRLHTSISGRIDSLEVASFTLHALKGSRLEWNGRISNINDIDAIKYNLPTLVCHIPKGDINLINRKKINNLPKYIEINSNIEGSINELITTTLVSTPEGRVMLTGNFGDFNTIPYYKGNLKATGLKLNNRIDYVDRQPVSFVLNFDGKGNDIYNLSLNADLRFSAFQYADTDLSALGLKASIKKQTADVYIQHHGKELYVDLQLNAHLDTLLSKIKLDLKIQKADLQALGLSDTPLLMALDVSAGFEGNENNFVSNVSIQQGQFVREGISYDLIPVVCKLTNQAQKTDLTIQSGMLNGYLKSNKNIKTLIENTEGYIARRFQQDTIVQLDADLILDAHFEIAASSVLKEVLIPELERLDNVMIDIHFQPEKDIFNSSLIAPYTTYGEMSVEDIAIYIHAKKDSIYGDFGFGQLKSNTVSIPETNIALGWKDNFADLIFSISDLSKENKLEHAYIALKGHFYDDSVLVTVLPEHLVLEGEQWQIKPTNKVVLSEQLIHFTDFEINNREQKISLLTDVYNDMHRLKINFKEFSISAISSLFDVEGNLADGVIDGEISLLNMNATPAILAALSVSDLTIYDVYLGELKINADNLLRNKYKAEVSLFGPSIELIAAGNYMVDDTHTLNLSVDVNKIALSLIETLSQGQLKNTSGKLLGHFDISGTLDNPDYDGSMYFSEAAFTFSHLNAPFLLSNERIYLDNSGLRFNQFTILDSKNQKTKVNGTIITTESLVNPRFDLTVDAKQFQLLNSTRDDNDLFYGRILVDSDIRITGNLNLPKVRVNARLLNETNVSYIIPETEVAIEERNSVVIFENKRDTVVVLANEKPSADGFEGVDLKVFLLIDPKTTFNIIFDERSGDHVTVSGEANLTYNLQANGTMELSGRYIVTGGAYEMSLYDLVKKKFELVPGSSITWTGDPFMASLDMTAKYRIRTSSVDLMADQLTGVDASTITRYRQELPFDVLLHIGGNIYQPEISFGLDMPDDHKDVLEGNVFRRIQQLKTDESQLNKQVFSLIVFNRFLPSNMNNDTGGGSMAGLARSSVSKMLSSQLNQLSEKYIKAVELNVDMDSYTDYRSGTAQDRTQVNLSVRKTLFDDRIVIKVGSQVDVEGSRQQTNRSNEIIGDVTLEYLLDKEGRYRAKAFRKNEFEDLVEGQILITGLSLLFNKEFNTISELKKDKKEKDTFDGD